MKKFLYLAFIATVFIACSQSPEQKAEELIKESLKKSLFKPETYKPVDTKVDSAFAPFDDPDFYRELATLGQMNNEYWELEEKAKRAKSSMSIWADPYQTAFGKNQYQKAKEEYEEANAQIEKLKTKGIKQHDKVVSMIQNGKKFIGYKAVHNYRADNNAGNTLIGNTVFFIDKDFKEITFSLDVEEYNQIHENISQLIEQLEETKE